MKTTDFIAVEREARDEQVVLRLIDGSTHRISVSVSGWLQELLMMGWTDSGDLPSNSKSPASTPNWLALLVRPLFPKNDIGICPKLRRVRPETMNNAIKIVAETG